MSYRPYPSKKAISYGSRHHLMQPYKAPIVRGYGSRSPFQTGSGTGAIFGIAPVNVTSNAVSLISPSRGVGIATPTSTSSSSDNICSIIQDFTTGSKIAFTNASGANGFNLKPGTYRITICGSINQSASNTPVNVFLAKSTDNVNFTAMSGSSCLVYSHNLVLPFSSTVIQNINAITYYRVYTRAFAAVTVLYTTSSGLGSVEFSYSKINVVIEELL